MDTKRLVTIAALCVLIQSCSDDGTSPTGLEGRQLWESLGLRDYVVNQRRDCFCVSGGRTVEVVVRADTIASIVAADSLFPPITGGPYMTIDSLFGFIDRSRAIPDAVVEVSYSQQYGYPETIFVDPLPGWVDDEVQYITFHFRTIR